MPPTVLYSDILFQISSQKFSFLSCNQNEDRSALIIDRVTHQISMESNEGQISGDFQARYSIVGIIGIINLPCGPALIIAKKKNKLGDITSQNHGVFQLSQIEIHPFSKSDHHLTRYQQEENNAFTSMVEKVLTTPYFFFSHSTDLSNTLQRKKCFYPQNYDNPSVTSLFTQWDKRFIWNRQLLYSFIEKGAKVLPFCIPLIHGAVFIRRCSINGKLFRYTLLSRRSVNRPGTRYFSRGCDEFGNCSNFVETEQIVEIGPSIVSFVQTRGSIPLYWSQYPNVIDYKPDPVIESTKNHLEGFNKHFTEQIGLYGQQVIVNLIDQTNAEGELEHQFKDFHQLAAIPNVEYVSYDFHKECSNLRWHRLSNLIAKLQPYLHKFNYFVFSDDKIESKQSGVLRTNCMDCLDRTNVVQSLISVSFLQSALSRLGILNDGQLIANIESFQIIFRNIWADHADILSEQYAGTGALKTDYTRTGKRTPKGMLADLQNSINRYFKNNFNDGFRQDSIDLFLGNYLINSSSAGTSFYANPSKVNTWTSYMGVTFVICLAVLFLLILFSEEPSTFYIIFFILWICITSGLGYMLYKNAHQFVDFPKLKKIV